MEHLCLILILAITGLSQVSGQCDMNCIDQLENWSVSDTKSCDDAGQISTDILDCRTQLSLDDPNVSPCSPEEQQRANGVLDAVENYLNGDCSNPRPTDPSPAPDCDSQENLDKVNEELIKCKPKDLNGLALNGILSKNNVCMRLQDLVDCVEEAMGKCRSDAALESLVSQNFVSYQLLSEVFECEVTIFENLITRRLQDCKFIKLGNCFNPILKAFGESEISNIFNLNMINGDLIGRVLGPLTTSNQANHCNKAGSIPWSTVKTCLETQEAACPHISGRHGYSIASVTSDPRAIITDLRSLYEILAAITKVETYCSADCVNFATKKAAIDNCLQPLTSTQLGTTPNCVVVNQAYQCAVTEAGSCSLLKEEAGLSIHFTTNAAAHVTHCTDATDLHSPDEVCGVTAQDQAYTNVESKCSFKYPSSEYTTDESVCSKARAFAACIDLNAGTCPQVAHYFHQRFAFFFGFINYNFGCSPQVSLQTNGVPYAAAMGTTCSYPEVLTCYKSLLDRYGATVTSGKLSLVEFKKLLFARTDTGTEFKNDHCSKLSGLDFAALQQCTANCRFASLTLPPVTVHSSTKATLTWNTGVLLDIPTLKTSYDNVCVSGCSSVTSFSSAIQGLFTCSQVGSDSKVTRLPNEIFYNNYQQKCGDLEKSCNERSDMAVCLGEKYGTCPYLSLVAKTSFLDTTEMTAAEKLCREQRTCVTFRPPPTTPSMRPTPDVSFTVVNKPLGLMIAATVLLTSVLVL